MLTNEEKLPTLLERFRACKVDENNETEIYMDGEGVAEVIAALELKESLRTLPAMAEVDALRDAIVQQRDTGRLWEPFRDSIDVLADLARRAIAIGETERKRADDNFKAFTNMAMQSGVKLEIRDQQLAERDAEIERLMMAVGCATTIKGDMVMRPDDPLGMMLEVCSYVADLIRERTEGGAG